MEYEKKHDKVIFIGKGHGWWDAPKNADGYDVWGINDIVLQRNDIDLLFNLHNRDDYAPIDMACCEFTSAMGVPIMMIKHYEDLPTSIEFPIKEMIEEFDTDYISTAIPYMFAYAAMLGYKQIDCYGINMRGNDEKYKNAIASVEFWIGICKGRGIKVNMYGKYCDCLKIFDRKIYGYNWLQTYPQDINDRALYVTFGASLDRVALDKFYKLCSKQPNSKYFDNMRPIPIQDPHNMTLFGNLELLTVKHGDGTKFVGDIGYYNLLHVDLLINSEHNSRILIFDADDRDAVKEDWLTFLDGKNPWTNPKCESWDGGESGYDAFFPKYDYPREVAFDKFHEEYIKIAQRAAYKFPGYIRIYKSSDLDDVEKQKEILKFIGYDDNEITLEEGICQTESASLEASTEISTVT